MFDQKSNRKFTSPAVEAKADTNNTQAKDHELDFVLGGATVKNLRLATEKDDEVAANQNLFARLKPSLTTSKPSDALI